MTRSRIPKPGGEAKAHAPWLRRPGPGAKPCGPRKDDGLSIPPPRVRLPDIDWATIPPAPGVSVAGISPDWRHGLAMQPASEAVQPRVRLPDIDWATIPPAPGVSVAGIPPEQRHSKAQDAAARAEAAIAPSGPASELPQRAALESLFGTSLAGVRAYVDEGAALARHHAQAAAWDESVAFAATPSLPLLAHEVAHVVQLRASEPTRAVSRREDAAEREADAVAQAVASGASRVAVHATQVAALSFSPDPGVLVPGDEVVLEIYADPSATAPDPAYSRRYALDAAGVLVVQDRHNRLAIDLRGATLAEAARRIAEHLVEGELYRGPRVRVTAHGASASFTATKRGDPALAEAYGRLLAYVQTVKQPAAAVARYRAWLEGHRDSPALLATTPAELWSQSLAQPAPSRDARLEHQHAFVRFINEQRARDAALPNPEAKQRAVATMARFLTWYEQHKDAEDFLSAEPASIYGQLTAGVVVEEVDQQVRQDLQARKDAAENSPERFRQRQAKFDEFFALAFQLWGYGKRFPYSIPLNAQGKDVLVTGDPAVEKVLSALGRELVSWATAHMFEAAYLTSDPKAVLEELLDRGYAEKLLLASQEPLQSEVIDRNEIVVSRTLASFGTAVAEGLFVVAMVAAFVGAEVITVGQATWILVGVAGAGGVKSYLDRRDEIERTGYDVSVPESIVHSAGDVVGVSQLVEGITGTRLGTGQALGSEARSEQLGTGAGSVATLLVGSRAYRAGEALGIRWRVPKRGATPPGPNAHVGDAKVPTDAVPAAPVVEGLDSAGQPHAKIASNSAEATQHGITPEPGALDRVAADANGAGALADLRKVNTPAELDQPMKKTLGEDAVAARARAANPQQGNAWTHGLDGAQIEHVRRQLGDSLSSKMSTGAGAFTGAELVKVADVVSRLRRTHNVRGVDDWITFEESQNAEHMRAAIGELRSAERRAAENTGRIYEIGQDAHAPVREGTINARNPKGDPMKSFDIAERDGNEVVRSIEVTSVDEPVKGVRDLTNGVRHATDKVVGRLKEKTPIPGKELEAEIRIEVFKGEVSAGTGTVTYDGAGNYTYKVNNGNITPSKFGRHKNPGNVFADFVKELPTIGGSNPLSVVTLVDGSGNVIATFRREGSIWKWLQEGSHER